MDKKTKALSAVAEDQSSPRTSRSSTKHVADSETIQSLSATTSPTPSPSSKKRKAVDPPSPLESPSSSSRYPKRARSVPVSPSTNRTESSKRKRSVGDVAQSLELAEEPKSSIDASPRRKRQAAVVAASNISSTYTTGRTTTSTANTPPVPSPMAKEKGKSKKSIPDVEQDEEDASVFSSMVDDETLLVDSGARRNKSRNRTSRKERKAKDQDAPSSSPSKNSSDAPVIRKTRSRQGDPDPVPVEEPESPATSSNELKPPAPPTHGGDTKDKPPATSTSNPTPPATETNPDQPHIDRMDEDEDDDEDDDDYGMHDMPRPPHSAGSSAIPSTGTSIAAAATNALRNYDILSGMSRASLSPRWRETLESIKSGEPDRQERALQEIANLLAMTQEGDFPRTMAGFSIDDFIRAWLEILQLPMPELDESIALFISELGDAAQDFLEELDPTHSGPIRVLCLRCLTNLLDVNPPSALHLIANDGITVLVEHCLSITRQEHRDIAENALAVIERIARDYSEAVIKAGALESCLNKLEFYSTHYQRIGSAAVSYACTRLPISRAPVPPAAVPHTLNMIELAVPYLPALINHHDAKVAENIVRATSHIVQWAAQWETVGDRVLGVAGDALLVNSLKLITPATPGNAPSLAFTNPAIFSHILKMFTGVAKGLPSMSRNLLVDLGFPEVLKGILTGGAVLTQNENGVWDLEELATVVASACQSRSSESLVDILTLASELLPKLPSDGIWTTRVPESESNKVETETAPAPVQTPTSASPSKLARGREAAASAAASAAVSVAAKYKRRVVMLKENPEMLMAYTSELMPILIEVFNASANSDVRRKAVECVAKAVAHSSDADILANALSKCKSFGKFVSDLIAVKEIALAPDSTVPTQDRRDALILVSAGIQIAQTVTTKCGDRLGSIFAREGVLSEMERVVELGDRPSIPMSPAKLAASNSMNDLVPYFKQMRNRSRLGGLLTALFGSENGPSMNNANTSEKLRRLRSLAEALEDAEDDGEEVEITGGNGGDDEESTPKPKPALHINEAGEASASADSSSKPAVPEEGSTSTSSKAEKGKAPVVTEETTASTSSSEAKLEKTKSTGADKTATATSASPTPDPAMQEQQYLQTLERIIRSEGDGSSPSPLPAVKVLNEESVSEADIQEWIVWMCRKIVAESRLDGAGLKRKDQVLDELRRLGSELKALSAPEGDSEPGGLALSTLNKVAQHFATQSTVEGVGITGFEILESGIIDAISEYLSTPAPCDLVEPPAPEDSEGNAVYQSGIMLRLRAFLHVFMNGPTPDPRHGNYFVPNAFRRLVQRLQESLARAERFEISTGTPASASAYTGYDGGSGLYGLLSGSYGMGPREAQNPSLQLARQLRIKLIAEDPTTVPAQYRALLVSVHAVAAFQSIEDFLKPKIAHMPPAETVENPATTSTSTSTEAGGTASTEKVADASTTAGNPTNSGDDVEKPQPNDTDTVADAPVVVQKTTTEATPVTNERDVGDDEDMPDHKEDDVAIREQIAIGEHDEDHDMDDEYHDDGDDDDMMDDQTGSTLSDLLLHTEEMQRLHRGQNETSTPPSGSSTHRRTSVVDLRLDPPASSPTTESQPPSQNPATDSANTPPQPPSSATTTDAVEDKSVSTSQTTQKATASSSTASMSYASVAAAGQNSFKVQFIIDDTVVPTSSTIFGALYSSERSKRIASGQSASQINVFSQICSIKYRKVPINEASLSADKLDDGEKSNDEVEGTDNAHKLKVRLPYETDAPTGVAKDSIAGKLMHLLRLLYGLNTSWHDIYSEDESDSTAVELDSVEAAAAAAEDSVLRKPPQAVVHVPHDTTPITIAPLPLKAFNSSKLTAKLNRQLDEPLIVAGHVLPDWCTAVARDFSFLVPFETRLIYLQSTSFGYSRSMNRWQNAQQQQSAASGSRRAEQPQLLGRMSRQKVRIPRARLLDTMIKIMESWGSTQSLLEIEYQDEVGTGLGPTLEFYSTVCREVRLRSGVAIGAVSKSKSKRTSSSVLSTKASQDLIKPSGAYRVWRDDGGMGATRAAKKPSPTKSKSKSSKGKGKPPSSKDSDDVEMVAVDAKPEEPAMHDEVVNSPLGLFPAPMTQEQAESEAGERVLNLFLHLGTFVAKALLDSRIIDLPFSPLFIELVVMNGVSDPSTRGPLLHSIKHVDPSLHASLLKLRQCVTMKKMIENQTNLSSEEKQRRIKDIKMQDASIEDLSLDFTLPGYPDIELVDDGTNVPVTLDNLDLYIDRVTEMTISEGIMKQVNAFRQGFNLVFPISDLKSFTVQELSVMTGGSAEEDWSPNTIADAIKADHGYSSTSQQVEWLVNILSDYDKGRRREFLQFVSGAPKLPFGGFKVLNPPLTVVRRDGRRPDEDLPSVMTCTNYLKIPPYSSMQIMKERLGVAIREGAGCFHLS
ncbi:hypothetical protein SmJEL517_g03609 [Synchytrium microbalum]|uniref:HECT-type E3 ubiquitin transferase n=1 Tax=Synchytrium microbalum TaxID=1806994 RepID=A0A507C396_9FUNG|nr:uncharacterized protein SmJEL517_g03609 [Synchytrium microbalum]TPX33519.1 hypothetical protein SmJEL517_g03609 [Synchytrium microbalum]